MTTDPASRAEALSFLKDHTAGVLATVAKDYSPHASAICYVGDDSFNIYFLTKRGTRKYAAIKAHPQVAFTVGRMDIPQTLQIEGVASELESEEDKNAHVPDLMNVLATLAPGFVPVGKMDDEMTIMWIQPKWVRWADFSKPGLGNESVFTEIAVD